MAAARRAVAAAVARHDADEGQPAVGHRQFRLRRGKPCRAVVQRGRLDLPEEPDRRELAGGDGQRQDRLLPRDLRHRRRPPAQIKYASVPE